MIVTHRRRKLASFLLVLFLISLACGGSPAQPTPTSRWDPAQQTSTAKKDNKQGTAAKVVDGSKFNKLFPKGTGGYDVVFAQEKKGSAEAKLKKDGKEVATLSISDTAANPDAAQKYGQSKKKIAGYPVVDIGSNGTGLLVADRFQVQIRSKDSSFTKTDREAWLPKFDLSGLAQLE